jgi:ATP/maltotriose-dependent transcriptional regulator MalT
MAHSVERARAAFARRDWADAFAAFAATAAQGPLEAADHERLAVCAYLVGQDEVCARSWEAAHRTALEAGDAAHSARSAFWLAFCLMMRGQMAQAGGWLGRAERLVEESAPGCAASGYLLIPRLLGALEEGDAATAATLAVEATDTGNRLADPDLRAFGTLGHGQALLAMGDPAAGMARLDEVMVAVTAGEVGPITSGIVYCAVILECMRLFDLRRATEWTAALSAWCDAQPALVPYRGQCLVHRSQLQQAAGNWPDALTTAAAACLRLADPVHPALGLAFYQEAELHRLVGAFAEAEHEYRQAARHGLDPIPGLALLKLAGGDAGAAAETIRRALQEAASPRERPALLAAAVDILGAVGDRPGVRSAAGELATIAASSTSQVLWAMAAQATGAALVGEGDPVAGLAELRVAATSWRALHMPYEVARVEVLLGLACSALGDRTSAALEFDTARQAFTDLGAIPDLERLAALTGPPVSDESVLSHRECQVLALVAAGRTNREIAAALVISQHTAGRHVENIFAKLGVNSRAAATAYAYEHHLL